VSKLVVRTVATVLRISYTVVRKIFYQVWTECTPVRFVGYEDPLRVPSDHILFPTEEEFDCVFHGRRIKRRRMLSSGMLRRVALVGTDISEELSTSFIRVTKPVN
jgi:hypothetical protein